MASPLAGAWELEADDRQGFAVYTDTHFALVVAPKGRSRSESGQPSDEEIRESYFSVAALSGTYTISGSTATLKRVANSRAELVGEDMVLDFTLDGDKLTIRTVSGSSRPGTELMWRKAG